MPPLAPLVGSSPRVGGRRYDGGMSPLKIAIGKGPDHGFDEPLGLLSDCHRRIEHFLGVLLALARKAGGDPLDAPNRQLLDRALTYFRTAAPRHTEDEEASLFPRLRAASDPRAAEALRTLDELEADHREAERRHARVDELGRRWLRDGRLSDEGVDSLVGHLEALSFSYARHIGIEDKELFPAAGRILGASDLEEVGREMASRRGVPFAPPAELRRT
jgi:hemerythrin-like domain-containing protein